MHATQLCIARHGETDWNKSGILQGWADVPINALGRRQAHGLAADLASAGFTAVWSSPLVRALETAQIVAQTLGLAPPQTHDGLRERHFGAFQGIPKQELARRNPALLEQILRRNPAAEFVGGESMNEFADRSLRAFADIGAHNSRQRVLVVTHGWVMDVVTRHISGLQRDAVMHVKRKNGEGVWVEVRDSALSSMQA
jgi:probable phosphoglycerate mutase